MAWGFPLRPRQSIHPRNWHAVARFDRASSPPAPKRLNWLESRWVSQGIQTKILVPLVLLMLLSLLGSLVGYVLSTNATRNRIIDEQIQGDYQRVAGALASSDKEVAESALALARSPELPNALETSDILLLDRQAFAVQTRFHLDQVLILDTQGQALVNITSQSYLSQISAAERQRILAPSSAKTTLTQLGSSWLLVGNAPVFRPGTGNPARLATVYTFLNISEALADYPRELGLLSEIVVLPQGAKLQTTLDDASKRLAISQNGYRELHTSITLGGQELPFVVRRSEAEINDILDSGFAVVALSNGITLLFVLLIGLFLARSFARPLRKLSRVAQAVAGGDLAARAHLLGNDEIGQLGQAFDSATSRITSLLDQQARSAGERHAILQSIADGVLAIDSNEQIIIINPTAAALLGREQSSLLASPLAALVDVSDPVRMTAMELIVEQVRGELSDTDFAPTEHTIGLGTRIIRLQSAPIRVGTNERIGAVVVMQDVTVVVEADRSKTEFIATASHELRTPLASIKGYIDLFQLLGAASLSEQQREFLKVMKRQADHMTSLVNDLLEMARVDRGALRVNPTWNGLSLAIEEVLTALHEPIRLKQVQIQVQIPDDLPSLWIDTQHLRRILLNLLSNAIKYVRPNGWVRVRVSELQDETPLVAFDKQPWPHDDERSLLIEVEDDGVGIRAEDQPKIFERFFRSENPLTVEAGGTGLGLAITEALVEHNSGQIGFRSVEGMGSCFWIRLPLATASSLALVERDDTRVVGDGAVKG
jgi:signal transduction histidine kinase/HAMP domain-containing protein